MAEGPCDDRSPNDASPHRNPSPSTLDPSPASPGDGQGSGAKGGGGAGGESSEMAQLSEKGEKEPLISEKLREMYFLKPGTLNSRPLKLRRARDKRRWARVEEGNPLLECVKEWEKELWEKQQWETLQWLNFDNLQAWLLLPLMTILIYDLFKSSTPILYMERIAPMMMLMFLTMFSKIPGLIWKYCFWLLVGTMLKSNKALALKLADFVRRMIPHLAPCNALQDDVTCTATTSTFIARTDHFDIDLLRNVDLLETIDGEFKPEMDFSNLKDFKIGEGTVSVTKLSEDQYRFTCEVRGSLLEDFVAITDLESMARIVIILGLWEASPKVGVIDNLTRQKNGIYCHALNIKEIVEGVHKSPIYFVVFHLFHKKRFFVGCERRGTTTSKVMIGLTFFLSLTGAVACYYQLKESYPKLAIGSLVILGCLLLFSIIIELLGPLFTQRCFYWLCTLFCCNNANWRLGVYIWLNERGSLIPYCDDFEPDQLLLEDSKVEVNCLLKSVYKSRESFGVPFAVKRSPDWTMFPTININNLDIHDDRGAPWTTISTNNNSKIKFKLFKAVGNPDDNYDVVTFKMELTYSSFFVTSSRVIHVKSEYDRTQTGGKMSTQVSFNGRVTSYDWSVSSFHLFVYLMLIWGKMNHGVIERYENFMFRTYNHVFSVHGLAKHVEEHGLEAYFVLLADQTTQLVRTISQPVLVAKKDVNVITSCCNRLLRPCRDAFGHQFLGSVSV